MSDLLKIETVAKEHFYVIDFGDYGLYRRERDGTWEIAVGNQWKPVDYGPNPWLAEDLEEAWEKFWVNVTESASTAYVREVFK